MFSYTIPLWVQWLFPSLTWKVKTGSPKVYFTFDDGPHPTITPWVLAQLEQYNAKATFFCVGDNVKKFPETYQRILNEGHITGNHTFHHLNGLKVSNETYFKDIEDADQQINSNLFRPPYGKITPVQSRFLLKKYRIIMWDILTRDFDKHINVNVTINLLKRKIKPGSIIVFHDSEKAEPRLKQILPQLLEHCKQKQYTFEPL